MRITKRTNIAVHVLMYCAATDDGLVTKSEIADYYDVSENHLAQVINQLANLGLLRTQRGRNGGIALGRPAEEIRIGEVFRELEAPGAEFEYLAGADHTNPLIDGFHLKIALTDAAELFYQHLDGITLDMLLRDEEPEWIFIAA